MNNWQVPEGTCHTCGHPFRDHCQRVALYLLERLKRSRKQNRRLSDDLETAAARLAAAEEQVARYRSEVQKLNEAVRKLKEPQQKDAA